MEIARENICLHDKPKHDTVEFSKTNDYLLNKTGNTIHRFIDFLISQYWKTNRKDDWRKVSVVSDFERGGRRAGACAPPLFVWGSSVAQTAERWRHAWPSTNQLGGALVRATVFRLLTSCACRHIVKRSRGCLCSWASHVSSATASVKPCEQAECESRAISGRRASALHPSAKRKFS